MKTVSWFSAGVSSAVATKLMIDEIDQIIYTHIDDQHPDTLRFVKDCEAWFGKPVLMLQSEYRDVETVCRTAKYIIQRQLGAPCTRLLKREVRKRWEYELPLDTKIRNVWGMDYDEQHRATRLFETMPDQEHVFPLIDRRMSKEQAHEILRASGIQRPAMYDLGYSNNNCIGCVKGGMGYWNKIRRDFPAVFEARARMERDLEWSIFHGTYLDELDPERGREEPPIVGDCGLLCELLAI